MMSGVTVLFSLVVLPKAIRSFVDPQTYDVKMYQHLEWTLTSNNESRQNAIFYLKATNEDQQSSNWDENLQNPTENKQRKKRQYLEERPQEQTSKATFESSDQQNNISFPTKDNINENLTYEYDYDKMKNEYYYEETTGGMVNVTDEYEEFNNEFSTTAGTKTPKLHLNTTQPIDVILENYCGVVLLFRIRVIQCFWIGWTQNKHEIMSQAAWVLAFWFTVYLCIAGFYWCTQGWCCCCCPCSFCHPRSVIQEAKEFLAQNPPGTAHLSPGDRATYSPTDSEVFYYNELEKHVFNF